MLCDLQQGVMNLCVAGKAFGPADQPEVELVLPSPDVGDQLRVEALGVVDQITGVNLEEARQEHPARVRQVRPPAALDLREVRLADRLTELVGHRARHLGLGHLTVEAAERSLDQPQVAKLFSKRHSRSQSSYSKLL